MKQFLKSIIKFFSSLKLTILILALIIISAIPATLIVQNRIPEFYITTYPGTIGYLILATGYNHFFSSPLFLFLLGVFWLNLFSCSIKRFAFQFSRKQIKKRFGPDILHFGLIILIISSMVSFSFRQEGYIFMREGDALQLPSGRYLNLEEFIYEQYPNGRPKSWISRVNISKSYGSQGTVKEISVNKPLRIDKIVIYQSGYRPSTTVGEYETGLMMTSDPGKKYILISFLFITAGLILTFIQKLRDQRIKL